MIHSLLFKCSKVIYFISRSELNFWREASACLVWTPQTSSLWFFYLSFSENSWIQSEWSVSGVLAHTSMWVCPSLPSSALALKVHRSPVCQRKWQVLVGDYPPIGGGKGEACFLFPFAFWQEQHLELAYSCTFGSPATPWHCLWGSRIFVGGLIASHNKTLSLFMDVQDQLG